MMMKTRSALGGVNLAALDAIHHMPTLLKLNS
jgi:hypothetical protein